MCVSHLAQSSNTGCDADSYRSVQFLKIHGMQTGRGISEAIAQEKARENSNLERWYDHRVRSVRYRAGAHPRGRHVRTARDGLRDRAVGCLSITRRALQPVSL